MMYLISAVPGSGKTLRIVGIIKRKLLAENAKLIVAGRPPRLIYSNVKGLRIAGILPLPDDWRDTPEHSIVITDEAQLVYPASGGSGISKDERVLAMTTHRHTGHDLYFLTQDPVFLDGTLRKLCGHHEHLWRASSLQAATVYSWDSAQSSPMSSGSLKLADMESWAFPKEDYGDFDSATQHTHKFKMPRKILMLGVALVIVFGGVAWMIFFRAGSFAAFRTSQPAAAMAPGQAAGAPGGVAAVGKVVGSTRPPTGSELWAEVPVLPALAGCAVLSASCRAWNMDGGQLDLSDTECRTMCGKPLPLDFSEAKKRAQQVAQLPAAIAPVLAPDVPRPVLGSSWDTPRPQIPGSSPIPGSLGGSQ